MQDEFYVKHMVDKQVLGPILDVLLRTLPRDNLLSSACLELFMLVSKENIKELIKQMVENYREKVMALAYIPTFNEILHRYDQTQGFTINIDPYFESEDELGRGRPPNGAARGMMEHLSVDQAQEDYWNTSDDEEDFTSQQPSAEELQRSLDMMADRSPSKPLVEYTSDEEVDENDAVMTTLPAGTTTGQSSGDESTPPPTTGSPAAASTNGTSPSASATAAAAAAAAAPPPERLSEKRRREEDEDDDVLDKLTQHKRRNSSSAASNASLPASTTAILRKKRSFTGHGHGASTTSTTTSGSPKGGGGGGGGLKKIAISISQAAKAAVVKADEGGGGDGSGRE
jgi:protein phosphatase-4 regulatory subunit 3